MLSYESIRSALKNECEPRIYSRGLDYFRQGRVRVGWSVAKGKFNNVLVEGRVKGTELYDVTLCFDEPSEFLFSECTCPYGEMCKHTVALGLAYAESLKTDTEEEGIRKALQELGFSVETMPENLIGQLLRYQKPKPATSSKSELFNPDAYFVALASHSGYTPSFHKKNAPHQTTSIVTILKHSDVSPTDRELLTYLKEGNFDRWGSPKPELNRLFPLLKESSIPVFRDYFSYGSKPITINLNPEPLKAEIAYKPSPMYADETKIRHNFFLRMPKEYWDNERTIYDKTFFSQGATLVHSLPYSLEVHQLTPLLTDIISRVQPGEYATRLLGEEVEQFPALVEDASRLLALSSPAPALTTSAVTSVPKPALQVTFDNTAQTLAIAPIIDYGHYKQDISESIYVSRRAAGETFRRNAPFEHPNSHIITVENGNIHHAKVDEKKEIGFYKEMQARAEEFAFTKTLKCTRRGEKQLYEYLRHFWPKLSDYATKKGYEIIFAKDKLAVEQTTFRADFTADMVADNDWLYFDVSCYCGGERVTLEKLMAFMESGQQFWRKEDGTLVEITNREELERLARLLKSFAARENGGFEGRLHHAPELEYVMTCSPHYNAVRAKGFKQFMNRIESGKPLKKISFPKKLSTVLRPYQKEGIEWFYFLRSYRFAGILADDMGLGKTLQTLGVMSMEKSVAKPSLVVCPKTLLYNWKMETEKFFPEMRTLVYDGTPEERSERRTHFKKYDLVIASYGTMKRDEEFFSKSKMRFNYVVLDEAQFIKNHATKNAQIVKKINADYRLALTGTPLENSVSELWSIYDFLMPGFLGTYEHFAKHFHRPIMDAGDRKALEHLRRKVESFMLRRTKAEVLKELPPKIETESRCILSEAQNILYQQILAQVRGDIFGAVKLKGFKSAQIHIFAGLTKLRQACNHPALLTKDKNFGKYESAKLEMCMELVREAVTGGRKVLIFSQFTQMLDIVSAELKDEKISHLYLSGKTKDRQSMVNAFNQDPSISIFLISLKAGGTGLNLTSADMVIIFDPWWNGAVENQAVDRAHRIGQTKTVNVYRLLTSGTIEEKIQALKQKKQNLFNALVNESGDAFKKLTWDDVRELFA